MSPSGADRDQPALAATGGSSPSIRFDVARTPEEVYEFLVDTANWARMDPAMVSLTLAGPVVVGSSGTATPGGTAVQITDRLWATSLLGRLMVRFSGGTMDRDLEERSGRLKSLVEAGDRRDPGGAAAG